MSKQERIKQVKKIKVMVMLIFALIVVMTVEVLKVEYSNYKEVRYRQNMLKSFNAVTTETYYDSFEEYLFRGWI